MTRDELYTFFERYQAQAKRLSQKKNEDYARSDNPFENFDQCGEYGFVTRMSDKMTRLKNVLERIERNRVLAEHGIAAEENGVFDESVEDTLMDLFNYCWLLAAYRESRS
jgi:hypothetical protein